MNITNLFNQLKQQEENVCIPDDNKPPLAKGE